MTFHLFLVRNISGGRGAMKGGFNEKGFLEGVAVKEPSFLVDKRAVCILLECSLVYSLHKKLYRNVSNTNFVYFAKK